MSHMCITRSVNISCCVYCTPVVDTDIATLTKCHAFSFIMQHVPSQLGATPCQPSLSHGRRARPISAALAPSAAKTAILTQKVYGKLVIIVSLVRSVIV